MRTLRLGAKNDFGFSSAPEVRVIATPEQNAMCQKLSNPIPA
jgi:hypothetical protein